VVWAWIFMANNVLFGRNILKNDVCPQFRKVFSGFSAIAMLFAIPPAMCYIFAAYKPQVATIQKNPIP
jgi:hypothetical protein